MKIVVNRCWGGFSLSDEACTLLNCETYDYINPEMRNDFNLISAVETLGKDANGLHANLVVKEISDEATDYTIIDYDGMENIVYVVNGKLYIM